MRRSPSDLRREVRDMVAAGQSDDQIREFMIARYGDFVLYRPRMTPMNFLLWAAPVLLLLAGRLCGGARRATPGSRSRT